MPAVVILLVEKDSPLLESEKLLYESRGLQSARGEDTPAGGKNARRSMGRRHRPGPQSFMERAGSSAPTPGYWSSTLRVPSTDPARCGHRFKGRTGKSFCRFRFILWRRESARRRPTLVPRWLRAVAVAVHHAEKFCPRTNSFAILIGHDARELVQMSEIMGRPGGQQL